MVGPRHVAIRLAVACALLCGCDGVFKLGRLDPYVEPDASTRWEPPRLIGGSPLMSGDDPTLTQDRLNLYFELTNDIYLLTRASVAAPWAPPVKVTSLSSATEDNSPELSHDGTTMYFSRGKDGKEEVYAAKLSATPFVFDTPIRVAELNDTMAADDPGTESADGLIFVMARNPTGTNSDLFISTRMRREDPWSPPVAIPELATPEDEEAPQLSPDGLTLYYVGKRGLDQEILMATRPTLLDPFTSQSIEEISTADEETDPWVSADGLYMVFVRDIGDQSGETLWETSRAALP